MRNEMSLKFLKSLLFLAIAIVGFVRAMYDVRIETFTKIKGDIETLMEFNLRLIGRQHLLNGTIVNHVDFDDTFEIFSHVESFVNGEWKASPMAVRLKVCAFMDRIYGKYWESSLKDSNMPIGKEACPFKKGEYHIKNVEFHADNWATYAKRGQNMIELRILKNNITYGGFVSTGFLIDRNI
ncbi:uncharacterized protein [Drosophila kikkawai]|uniref:Uncharacterized protein n=1 Tax=Drosophila kikkawai TaxID=30033 RepID=A0ABM4GRB6_DROKI